MAEYFNEINIPYEVFKGRPMYREGLDSFLCDLSNDWGCGYRGHDLEVSFSSRGLTIEIRLE